jgi:hypothetical protein
MIRKQVGKWVGMDQRRHMIAEQVKECYKEENDAR